MVNEHACLRNLRFRLWPGILSRKKLFQKFVDCSSKRKLLCSEMCTLYFSHKLRKFDHSSNSVLNEVVL